MLAGHRSVVELTHNKFLSLGKPWPVAVGGGARCGAMVCFILLRVATEIDRKMDLSHHVYSTRCEWLVWRRSGASRAQFVWAILGIGGGQGKCCSGCGGGRALGGGIHKDFKVAGDKKNHFLGYLAVQRVQGASV